jgi:hypothetical protein
MGGALPTHPDDAVHHNKPWRDSVTSSRVPRNAYTGEPDTVASRACVHPAGD